MTQPLVNDYNNNIIKFKEQGLSIWEIADRLGGLTPSNLEWARSLSELDISVSEVMLQYDTLAKGYDVEALMKSIMCPVLLLQGDPSTFSAMRDEDVEFVKSHLSQVVHVKLDGIGHGLGLEEWKAKQVISAMHHFLEAIR